MNEQEKKLLQVRHRYEEAQARDRRSCGGLGRCRKPSSSAQ